ncbi:hypothetical protein GTW78_16675 [Streptomyces sp. SID4948]|nr:hypothetical protein [Streptomyces sp. SID4948]
MRELLGILGAAVLCAVVWSVLLTLVIPRPSRSRLNRSVHWVVLQPFRFLADRTSNPAIKDKILAPAAPVAILAALLSWLLSLLVGYALLECSVSGLDLRAGFEEAGSSLFTLGFAGDRARGALTVVDFFAAASGMIIIGLQVGYLPALYGAYARRETEVTLLQARTGTPSWGPEILVRYAQVDLLDSIDQLFRDWERWAADVSESHTSYPALVQFRSPQPARNWLIALLAVLDAASLRLALNPSQAQAHPRLVLRGGYVCLREIAQSRGIPYDPDPKPDGPLDLTFEQFRRGIDHMTAQGYEIERTLEEAWPHFRGWRVNYEGLAYRLARDIEAVPAPWSGSRRSPGREMLPLTPKDRRPA